MVVSVCQLVPNLESDTPKILINDLIGEIRKSIETGGIPIVNSEPVYICWLMPSTKPASMHMAGTRDLCSSQLHIIGKQFYNLKNLLNLDNIKPSKQRHTRLLPSRSLPTYQDGYNSDE